jgi:hypothetical protein
MINEYEIGGNEIKVDASEAIADIPKNRTLLVEKLTAEEPVNPEVVTGLTTVGQVFTHFKPQLEVEFQNEEGQPVKETFHFNSVGDFSVKNMTETSSFLNKTKSAKDFYGNLTKYLRTNKVLHRALENPESKQALVATLQSLLTEMGEME